MKSEIRRRRISAIIDYDWANSGGGSVIPTDIPNLERWLQFDKEVGFNDGDLMSQITDWSGNGKHLTASGGNRLTYKTNILNGLPVGRCVGSSIYSSINGKADDNFKHQGDFTIIKVIRSNVDDSNHYFFDNCTGLSTNIGFTSLFRPISLGSNGSYRTSVYNGTGTAYVDMLLPNTSEGNPAPQLEGNPPTPKDVWHIIVERCENSKTYQTIEIEVNNILRGRVNKSGSQSASVSTSDPVWFGKVGGVTEKLNADFAYLAEWSRALTDAEIDSLIGNTL